MPNHVTNIITFGEDETDIKIRQILSDIKNDEFGIGSVDFNKLIPMPKVLDIDASSEYDKAYAVYMALEQGDYKKIDKMLDNTWVQKEGIQTRKQMTDYLLKKDPDALAKGKQYFDNLEKYGAKTWYDWCYHNWGTKWNAYGYEDGGSFCEDGNRSITFETAWAMPEPVIFALSQKYPTVEFEIQWADEDIGHNVGKATYQGGECTFENCPEGGSTEAIKMACEIIGYDPTEYLEDEAEFDGE